MRTMGGRRWLGVLATLCVAFGVAQWVAGPAGSLRGQPRHPELTFNATQQQVQLTIPSPACPTSSEHCEWMLFVDEPNLPGQPVVGMTTGSSGTLDISYPTLCGVMQADVLLGPAPWKFKFGHRR